MCINQKEVQDMNVHEEINVNYIIVDTGQLSTCLYTVRAEIFAVGFTFASQTLAKISTSIYVYLKYDNMSKIAKLTTRELPAPGQNRENNCTRK